ncbi:5'-deoxynucleotidase HDDC2 isoform X1 [Hydra vulgaris]|uniref:5'-deoxynucleotidase HDDC2 n=1 Tax=Hydra vulgaris TaxID=6087 RepID=T2MB53_HYDVU|nr:5'-deoxynucleotidase HDDC2 isoform X1 [Hydra vulgaris]
MACNVVCPNDSSDANSSLEFFILVGQLKTNKRTGWIKNNVPNPESISDHMYRMAIMAMLLNDNNISILRCIKMALVHDLAECIVGDITPFCGISPEEKYIKEKEAMAQLCSLVTNKKVGDDIMELWQEYSAQVTGEAKAVKDLDRFEMILQAFEYERALNRNGELESFFAGTNGKFQNDVVKSWVEQLNRLRLVNK